MPESLNAEDRLRMLMFACSFAWADLQIAAQERAYIKTLVKRLAATPQETEQVAHWLQVPPRAEDLDPEDIPLAQREAFLRMAREVIESDGDIDFEELENFKLFEQLLIPV